jgi:hypothetical protein
VTRDTTRLSKINGSTRLRPKPVFSKPKPANFVSCSRVVSKLQALTQRGFSQPGGSIRVRGENECEMGEEVMGIYRAKSNGRLVLGAYVRYFYLAVQRLSCMSRYYPAVNPKSSVCLVLLSVYPCTINRV